MKMLLCADIRLGAVCAENLDGNLSHKWQLSRMEKLTGLIDQAARSNAQYVAFFGQIFGQERTPESVVDSLFQAINTDKRIQILAFLTVGEYNRISYRNDLPKNFHLICTQTADSFLDNNIALRIDKGSVELQLADNDSIWIRKKPGEERFVLIGFDGEQSIPAFEPIGFEDALEKKAGYILLEWAQDKLIGCSITEHQTYSFRSLTIKINPEDEERDITKKINAATASIGIDTFLRVTITGRTSFGLTFNTDVLKKQLQNRVFYAEIYDNSKMDVDESAFEHDISLRSEFVRLALRDDSLSESERSRLISCGWNALNGKEVSAK